MAWGSVTTSTALTLTSSFQTVQVSAADMETALTGPYEVALFQIECDFQASPTDDCEWQILGSLDGSTYDTEPVVSGKLVNTTDPARVSVPVAGYDSLIVQARQDGATDTTNAVTVRVETGS